MSVILSPLPAPDVSRGLVCRHGGASGIPLVFLLLSLLSSCLFAVVNPPFMVPDEQQHFARAYQLAFASGRVVVQDGRAGAELPASIIELSDTFLHTRDLHGRRVVESHSAAEMLASLQRPLDPGRTIFVDFSGAAFYSPLPYLPQLAGLTLARWAGQGPGGLFYAGRLVNAMCASLLAWLAIRIVRGGAVGLAVIGLLPMTQYLFGSLSPDASVVACSMLAIGVVSSAVAAGRWSALQLGLAIAAGLVVCSLKPVYAPLLLVGAVGTWRQAGLRHAVVVYGVLVSVVVGCTLAWLSLSKSIFVQPVQGTDAAGQLAHVLARPQDFALAFVHAVQAYWPQWLFGVLGLFGWLNLSLPILTYLLVLFTLCASVSAAPLSDAAPGRPEAVWTLLMVLAAGGLVVVALYIYWTPVGAPIVEGIQGRYFLPLAGASMFCLNGWLGQRSGRWRRAAPMLLVGAFILALSSVVTIIRAYDVV